MLILMEKTTVIHYNEVGVRPPRTDRGRMKVRGNEWCEMKMHSVGVPSNICILDPKSHPFLHPLMSPSNSFFTQHPEESFKTQI